MKDIGTNTHRADWFALYRNDGEIDDVTVISGIRRAYFRLHPVGRLRESDGCVTLPSLAQFTRLRAFLKAQPTFDVSCSEESEADQPSAAHRESAMPAQATC